ncbi:hypothetical protein [Cupriavidus basilensis]|uniref:hypothetical protein n=1 Tax=Cupriavidus basilensis TaxID=68895 RepID=UPI0020A65FD3|nr:hypothetical protein [Cupriavidus basilensis]MCP3023339.1 hypothetical protein [Cupriavidus basilensis]
MMKVLIFTVAVLISIKVSACTPPFLGYDAEFEPGMEALSAKEVIKLAEWKIQLKEVYPNGGRYYIRINEHEGAGVPGSLAEARRRSLLATLSNLGVSNVDIAKVVVGKFTTEKTVTSGLRRYANIAELALDPRCPHPCCPGPQPLEK